MREAIADLTRQGYEYVINTSGGRITVMSSLASGWRSATAVEPMVKRSKSETVRQAFRERVRGVRGLWRLARRSGATVISSTEPFRRVDKMGRLPAAEPGASIVAEQSPRVAAMAELIERLPYDGRIRQVRDEAYLSWRYRNPIRQYRFFYYERAGRLEGYLVLARYIECQLPTLPFHIVDWKARATRRAASCCSAQPRSPAFRSSVPGATGLSDADRALLDQSGFVPTDLDMRKRGMPCILVKHLRGNTPPDSWSLGGGQILDPARWDMRLVYTMHG